MLRIPNPIYPILLMLFTVMSSNIYANDINVRFLYVGTENSQAHMGVQRGLLEANLQGKFLGQTYELASSSLDKLNENIKQTDIAILADLSAADLIELSNQYPNHTIMNVTSSQDSLREDCIPNLLHVIPSDSMMQNALEQWQIKKPETKAIPQAWHPDFVKFAARDLNKRFKKSFEQPMLDHGWAGWASVKMISDTVAREGITDTTKMLDYLKTELTFDGQKGINMTFRETGQLSQPILIIEDDKIVAEAPVRGVANPPGLDSLGLLVCPK